LKSEYFTTEALECFGDFKVKEQAIRALKYADDLVLRTKKKTVIQSMIDKLIEIGSCYGIQMNVE
jgi:hypothetical protein